MSEKEFQEMRFEIIKTHLNGMGESEMRESLVEAMNLITDCGQIDGNHHKLYILDQIARKVMGNDYDEWVKRMKNGEDGPETYWYDEGVAP